MEEVRSIDIAPAVAVDASIIAEVEVIPARQGSQVAEIHGAHPKKEQVLSCWVVTTEHAHPKERQRERERYTHTYIFTYIYIVYYLYIYIFIFIYN